MGEFRPAYRKQMRRADLEFVADCLAPGSGDKASVLRLLVDPDTVDSVLDQPRLLRTVLESVHHLGLSSRLYFYLLTRHSLKNAGLDDPDLADYVSGVLESFVDARRSAGAYPTVFYVVDWLKEIEKSPDGRRYELYVSAGNQLLYLTGVFPHFLEKRKRRRGAPDIAFYEDVARHSFRSAAHHPRSLEREMGGLYTEIADTFPDLRRALNDLSERLVFLND